MSQLNYYAPAGRPVAESDAAKVKIAAGTLMAVGLLQVVYSSIRLAVTEPPESSFGSSSPDLALITVGVGVVIGLVNVGLGLLVRRGSYHAAVGGLVLAGLGLLGGLLSLDVLAIAINLGIVVVVFLAVRAMRAITLRKLSQPAQDPLTVYYRSLIKLMTRVMAADHQLDSRERQTLTELLDGVTLPPDEVNQLIAATASNSALDVNLTALEYLEHARTIEAPEPAQTLVEVLTAVAAADGVILPQEEKAIIDISRAMGLPDPQAAAALARARADLDQLTPATAAILLGISEDAPRPEIDAAHHRLKAELQVQNAAQISQYLAQQLQRRQEAVDRAHGVLATRDGQQGDE